MQQSAHAWYSGLRALTVLVGWMRPGTQLARPLTKTEAEFYIRACSRDRDGRALEETHTPLYTHHFFTPVGGPSRNIIPEARRHPAIVSRRCITAHADVDKNLASRK